MEEAVSSKGWLGLELEGPRLRRAGRQAATTEHTALPSRSCKAGWQSSQSLVGRKS